MRLPSLSTWTLLTTLLASFLSAAAALSCTADPFSPPSYPLAVRSPYLSAWLPQGNGTALNGAWPTFWTGSILGWAGFIRVDGTAFSFLGSANIDGSTAATQKAAKFTSTQSVFVLGAGGIDLTATFLSPVEPDDLVKQSIPFAYLSLSVASNDGASHSVQIYTDISAEWISGDNALVANWNTSTGDSIWTHQVQLANQTRYEELNDRIHYGSAYYSTKVASGLTYQTGPDVDLRKKFVTSGVLGNTQDTNFRAVSENWPVFAFARDMGSVTTQSDPFVLSIGHVRDPAIQYITQGGALQDRSLYFWSQYSSIADLISSFLGDYAGAMTRAQAFDSMVQADAVAISSSYAAVVALSIRQTFAATEITISKKADGSWNTDDVLIFMKEISSDGNTNTVDVIFPSWPQFLYTNPNLGKYLLLPLLQYQATGQYPHKYSVHDIGAHYPKAIGHNDGNDEAMPLEECGNMIIMVLSHYHKTGDTSILTKYASLLDQWTQYLIEEALVPANQISTDDFAGPLTNQTNLAIKGIVGIHAMAEISCILGDSAKSSNYTSIAENYVTHWQTLATSADGEHLTLSYGNDSSWGLAYNLYGEKLLGYKLFPQSVYDMQSTWYSSQLQPYGIPLDTRHTYTKTDWTIYTAAIATSTQLRDLLIFAVYKFASDGQNKVPFSDFYETTTGVNNGFRARPVVGGHLALMKGVLPDESHITSGCGVPPQSSGVGSTINGTGLPSSVRQNSLVGHSIILLATVVVGIQLLG